MPKRVFVVCMLDSIHAARWLAQFTETDTEFLLFASSPHRKIHPEIKSLLNGNHRAKFAVATPSWISGAPLWLLDKLFGNRLRASILRGNIRWLNPQVVHALELQNAGYVCLVAMENIDHTKTKLIVTNWGSDIFWFGQFPAHKEKLRRLLARADAYSCECQRDVKLAIDLGFKGTILPVIPNAGGFTDAQLEIPVPNLSERAVIAVKGYHGWVGRAKIAISALELISDALADFHIVVYSANRTTERFARRAAARSDLNVTVYRKGKLSHSEVLEIFSKARISIGVSLSDGISTSLLESMAMGSIPVQTSTACCDEWFDVSGVKIEDVTVESFRVGILRGLELSKTQAYSDLNRKIIRNRANSREISAIALSFYD